MGIDLLDVQFRIETVFGLNMEREFFPDLIARHHPNWKKPGQPRPDVTVGQIYDELLERLRRENRLEGDYSQLRTLTLHSVLDSLKQSFERPDLASKTPVTELLPPPLNRAAWNRLATSLDVEPPLIPWSTMTQVSYNGGCLVVVGIWFATFLFEAPLKYLVFAALGMLPLILWRSAMENQRFPPSIRNIQDLSDHILLVRLREPGSRWPEELVWHQLRDVMVDALGVDDHEVTPEARLIQDLGAD
jgi:hypothetical protein